MNDITFKLERELVDYDNVKRKLPISFPIFLFLN